MSTGLLTVACICLWIDDAVVVDEQKLFDELPQLWQQTLA